MLRAGAWRSGRAASTLRRVPEPREFFVDSNGIRVCVAEWPGEDPPVFFIHATGFHRRVWDEVVARLPGRHCFAMDARGHGRTAKTEPPFSWRAAAHDALGVIRALGLRGAVGCGHSGGGNAVTWAAALEPGAFASLVLVDPTIFPEGFVRRAATTEPHFASRRRNTWSSPEEMFDSFKGRKPFNRWDPKVLRDYCTYGLLPNPSGDGYVLACPPHIEAAVYESTGSGEEVYQQLGKLDIPVRVLRAAPPSPGARDMSSSPCAPDVASKFPRGKDYFVPQYSHFISMEDPAYVAGHIEEALDRRS